RSSAAPICPRAFPTRRSSDLLGELLTVLNLYGISWTTISKAAGTSRQSPINWLSGATPDVSRVRRLAALFTSDFGPPVSPADLEDLWRRTRDGQPSGGSEPDEEGDTATQAELAEIRAS